jgi:hypothetical protein
MMSFATTDGEWTSATGPPQRAIGSLRIISATVAAPAVVRSSPPQPIPVARLSDPHPLTQRLAQAIAEVLAGARPASQLSDVASYEVVRLLRRSAGRLGARPGEPQPRPLISSVHVTEPRPGVAEACAVINTGLRRRAIALRLETADGQWRCTALHVG